MDKKREERRSLLLMQPVLDLVDKPERGVFHNDIQLTININLALSRCNTAMSSSSRPSLTIRKSHYRQIRSATSNMQHRSETIMFLWTRNYVITD
uniref:Uncharacterized protein n=1 Tax=Steinernema glaseri TaxID=37863 RepID=A0A1I7ZTL3_9BILA